MYGARNLYKTRVGIEDINIYIPKNYFDLLELARIRGVEGSKYTVGLGCKKMAVLDPTEDAVTIAANAARNLIKNSDISLEDIGMLVVGTETAVDESKPIAVYLHKMLGLSPNCRTMDIKHACYAGTAALRTAMSWTVTPAARYKKALVVATDVAFYDLESPGEPTQGAGAVAMLVSTSPDILALDINNESVYTDEVMDFWRPSYRNSAIVDGHYSMECYLNSLEQTYLNYNDLTGFSYNDYKYFVFHTPFPKMARKAHKKIYSFTPHIESEESCFYHKTASTLSVAEEVGNIYNASLFSSLISLISFGSPKTTDRAGLFSYGSGSTAEFLSGIFGKKISSYASKIDLASKLKRRTRISYETYLLYRAAYSQKMRNNYFLEDEPTFNTPYIFLGIQDHKRKYAYIPLNQEIMNKEEILVI